MDERRGEGGLGPMLGWMLFPILPVVLGRFCYHTLNFRGDDPRGWEAERWFTVLGPLAGFGFLVGVLSALPRSAARGRLRSILASRSFRVGVGPWAGFLLAYAVFLLITKGGDLLDQLGRWLGGEGFGNLSAGIGAMFGPLPRWAGDVALWTLLIVASYGWVVIALLGLRAARRLGRLRTALRRGLALAIGFVGSLVGGFWAATALWRDYFFDKTPAPALLLALSAATLLTGCSQNLTVGDIRRRRLFEAMVTAWLLGLALFWRWWRRSRSRPAP